MARTHDPLTARRGLRLVERPPFPTSARTLERDTQIKASTWQNVLSGRTRNISPELVATLCFTYNLPVQDIVVAYMDGPTVSSTATYQPPTDPFVWRPLESDPEVPKPPSGKDPETGMAYRRSIERCQWEYRNTLRKIDPSFTPPVQYRVQDESDDILQPVPLTKAEIATQRRIDSTNWGKLTLDQVNRFGRNATLSPPVTNVMQLQSLGNALLYLQYWTDGKFGTPKWNTDYAHKLTVRAITEAAARQRCPEVLESWRKIDADIHRKK